MFNFNIIELTNLEYFHQLKKPNWLFINQILPLVFQSFNLLVKFKHMPPAKKRPSREEIESKFHLPLSEAAKVRHFPLIF